MNRPALGQEWHACGLRLRPRERKPTIPKTHPTHGCDLRQQAFSILLRTRPGTRSASVNIYQVSGIGQKPEARRTIDGSVPGRVGLCAHHFAQSPLAPIVVDRFGRDAAEVLQRGARITLLSDPQLGGLSAMLVQRSKPPPTRCQNSADSPTPNPAPVHHRLHPQTTRLALASDPDAGRALCAPCGTSHTRPFSFFSLQRTLQLSSMRSFRSRWILPGLN
ncbi:MAG: hypothetical protein RIQ71_738 [Verrucomicrobiota bacterium]